jgi:hypothetical protein
MNLVSTKYLNQNGLLICKNILLQIYIINFNIHSVAVVLSTLYLSPI